MGTILDTIAAYARERVVADQAHISLAAMRELALQGVVSAGAAAGGCRSSGAASSPDGAGAASAPAGNAFYAALKKPELSFICEVKKASPSKGIIAEDFPYLDIAQSYEAAGADAISCLTEPKWFLGSDAIFKEIRGAVDLPMLRKDFVVDEYQIYQARVMGADAVLLICALLDTPTIARYLGICDELGLAALVETHDEAEIRSAVEARARIIGVNNRNLKDFSVDFGNATRLRERIPPEAVYVAESGVTAPQDVAALRSIGADAVLVGEALMRSKDKGAMLAAMRSAAQ